MRVYQNIELIRAHRPKHVLVLAGDHIYKMDYGPMIAYHVEKGADITVGVVEVPAQRVAPLRRAHRDRVEPRDEVRREAGAARHASRASRFDPRLDGHLRLQHAPAGEAAGGGCGGSTSSGHDFGKNVLPEAIGADRQVFAYPFQDVKTRAQSYWRDVGTIDAYYDANIELVHVRPELNIYDEDWPIWTYQVQQPPAKFILDEDGRRGMAINSMVSGGCIISGAVVRESLLFSNVRVEERTHHPALGHPAERGSRPRLPRSRARSSTKAARFPTACASAASGADDVRRFHVTEKGVVLVTQDMLRAAHARPTHEQPRAAPAGDPAVAHAPAAVPRRAHRPATCCRGPTCTPSRTTPTWRRIWRATRTRARWSISRPVLIEQLEDIAWRIGEHLAGGAALPDPVLALLGPEPVPVEAPVRLELLRACLRAQRKQMIERFGPYLELATIAETLGTTERIAYASDQFIHDLAVWYHLAWLGETVRRTDPLVARLTERGRDFTAAQRRELLALIGKLVGQVVPRFRALAEAQQCELSVTPYGHPLIPLMLDFRSARDAVPAMPLPAHSGYPGGAARAAWHVEEGIRVFTRAFGARPLGCWPAEGAVSAATLELLAARGFRWAASSAGVLRGSLALGDPQAAEDPLAYNRPYRLGGTGMSCFFRDDALSDLIGFTYATWHGDDAAANLVNELVQLAGEYQRSGNHAVLIALDGENAWEHYPFNGYYFLRALYAKLAAHPRLELTTLSECLARGIQPAPLPRVCAGSWVHGDARHLDRGSGQEQGVGSAVRRQGGL